METGLLDRDPAGLDGLLWLLGLFVVDPEGDELDLLRPSWEVDGLGGRQFGKEPVDIRVRGLSLDDTSNPSLVQYTGGVWERGGVASLGDARLPKEGDGVLVRTGLISSLRSLNSLVIGTLRRTTLEFASDSTDLLLAIGVCQMGRGSLDPLLFCWVGERLVFCFVSDFELSDL